eukprot:2253300-Alexandrium_andersonii.AAC.1
MKERARPLTHARTLFGSTGALVQRPRSVPNREREALYCPRERCTRQRARRKRTAMRPRGTRAPRRARARARR